MLASAAKLVIGIALLARMTSGDYEDRSILCDGVDTICELHKSEYITDIQRECDNLADNGDVVRAFRNPLICNCGVVCIKYLKEGDQCKRSHVYNFPEEMCGPMLTCTAEAGSSTNYTCHKDINKDCVKKVQEYEEEQAEGILGPARARPNCDDEGKYAGVQCSPGTTCYCVDDEGNRLFGEAPLSKSQNMTCGCSLNWKDTIERKLNVGMRCLSDGNFDPLQCFGDVCYCFDPVSMELLQGPLHVTMMDQMSCFDKDYHYHDYLNPCERKLQYSESANTNGVIVIDSMKPSCNVDGYYAPIQRRGEYVYCADIHGEQIEHYTANIVDSDLVNCNCARRRAFLKAAGEVSQLPKCKDNGNYEDVQTTGMLAYCVDENGNQEGGSVAVTAADQLTC